MFLVRLVYVSTITEGFGKDDIENILESARTNNEPANVTGLLCFSRNYFLQCLEGSRSSVNAIYHKILNDERHTNILLLDYQEIAEREFASWEMGYVPEYSLTRPLNMRFSGTPDFNPYEMSGDSTHQMMLALRDTLPTV